MKILVLNGPNINLLGLREPELYGSRTYPDLVAYCEKTAAELGATADVRQTNHEGTLVDLTGIAHFVVEGVEPSEGFFRAAESIFSGIAGLDACGVIFLDAEKRSMTPLVKVIETGSLVWEGSCGSGSVACAVAQSERMENGGFSCEYRQPAGTVRASVERQGGNVIAASIGGEVTLDEPMRITL